MEHEKVQVKKREYSKGHPKEYGFFWQLTENVIAKSFWICWMLLVILGRVIKNLFLFCVKSAKGDKAKSTTETTSAKNSAAVVIHDALVGAEIASAYMPCLKNKLFYSEDGWGLHMRLFPGRIECILKTERERHHWQRSNIAYDRATINTFTAKIAAEHKLPFSFEGAQIYVQKRFANHNVRMQKPKLDEFDHVENAPIDQVAQVEVPDDSASPSGISSVVTGQVVSAGVIEVSTDKGRHYKTFQVSVKTEEGQEIQLSGVDLREKFESRVFTVKDVCRFEKHQTTFMVGTSKRKKNSFEVTVLSRDF